MNFMVLLHDEKRKVVLLDIKNEDEHHYIVANRFDDKADWNKRYFQCVPYYEPEALQEALDEYRRQTEPEYQQKSSGRYSNQNVCGTKGNGCRCISGLY